jgi:L-ascorbate metabolism protein UlaG (beta-lactamase superfamily)
MEQTTITRIGHATVLIQLPHMTILTDPVLFDRIGISLFGLPPLGLKRVYKAALSIDELPQIDLVLISHAHMDHLDVQSLRAITRKQPYKISCITAFNTKTRLKNFQRKEVYELDWNQEIDIL